MGSYRICLGTRPKVIQTAHSFSDKNVATATVNRRGEKMPSKARDSRRRSDGGGPESYEAEDPSDYLQDQALWADRLPQPFRMIDEVLEELLADSWEVIEEREVARQLQQARVHIPVVSEAQLVTGVENVRALACGHGNVIFTGSAAGLSVFAVGTGGREEEGQTSGDEESLQIVTQSGPPAVTDISVGRAKTDELDIQIVVATLETGIVRIFAYVPGHLVALAELSPQQEEREVAGILMALSCTHLAVDTKSMEDGRQLELHRLPLDNWLQELAQYLAAAEQEEGSQSGDTEVTYSKPALLLSINPPTAHTPSPASDPSTALHSVFEGCSEESLPTGEHHVLTAKYFEGRRKVFVSRRPDFVAAEPDRSRNDYKHSSPRSHFIYYKNAWRNALPCYLAVWWAGHSQLLIYAVEESACTKYASAPVPRKVFPQGAVVCSSAATADGGLLAMALVSGIVNVWNMRLGVCTCTLSAVNSPDQITSLRFIHSPPLLAVGTRRGRVVTVQSSTPSPLTKAHTVSLSERESTQREMNGGLFQGSGSDSTSDVVGFRHTAALPTCVLSVQADGSLTLWSHADREGLCRLRLPQEHVIEKATCTFTSTGSHMLIVGKRTSEPSEENEPGSLFYVDLHRVPQLSAHWSDLLDHDSYPSAPRKPTIMEMAESKLVAFNTAMYGGAQQVKFNTRRQTRWNELAKELH